VSNFAGACQRALEGADQPSWAEVESLLRDRHWDEIASVMERLMAEALPARLRQAGDGSK
jgi:hypothetical protein